MFGLLVFLVFVGVMVAAMRHAAHHKYQGYSIAGSGHHHWISYWTCKECYTMNSCPRRGAGFRCHNRKCRANREESVAYWRDRTAKGIPYDGPTQYVPTKRRDPQEAELTYQFHYTMAKHRAQGMSKRDALVAAAKELNASIVGYESLDDIPDDIEIKELNPRGRLS